METIKITSKNKVDDKNQLVINDASVSDPVDKAIKALIKNIQAGKGVDKKTLDEDGDGAVLAMFLKPIIQGAAVKTTDPRGFWKEFKGGLG